MSKRLYMIGGAMGVGKTAACQELVKLLPACAFLDGDWCWSMDPFQVTEETKKMVLENITYTLNNFLRCSVFQNIVFCWVLHQQAIWEEIRARLELTGWEVTEVCLVCTPEALTRRLEQDIRRGKRKRDILLRSRGYLPLYEGLAARKIDTSRLSPRETAEAIRQWGE